MACRLAGKGPKSIARAGRLGDGWRGGAASPAEAKDYIDRYFARFVGVKRYMDETKQLARDKGYVETMFGRRIYLPEIKYRRILNEAFGPGGWGLAPRGELVVGEKVVTREYALIVHGR